MYIVGDETLRRNFHAHCKQHFDVNYIGVPDKVLGMELEYEESDGLLTAKLSGARVAQKLIADQTLLPPEISTATGGTATIPEDSRRNQPYRTAATAAAPAAEMHRRLLNTDAAQTELLDEKAKKEYQRGVGGLNWLSVTCCPQLSYAVGTLATRMANPTQLAQKALHFTLGYVRDTIAKNKTLLVYKQDPSKTININFFDKQDVDLQTYVDASHECPRSITGYCIQLNGCLVDWSSKRQDVTSLSTSESEWSALSSATRQVIFMRDLLGHWGMIQGNPCLIHEDNRGVVRWAEAARMTSFARRKHIALKTFHVNDCVRLGWIQVRPVPTKSNLADVFTKPLHYKSQQRIYDQLMYGNAYVQPQVSFFRPSTNFCPSTNASGHGGM